MLYELSCIHERFLKLLASQGKQSLEARELQFHNEMRSVTKQPLSY